MGTGGISQSDFFDVELLFADRNLHLYQTAMRDHRGDTFSEFFFNFFSEKIDIDSRKRVDSIFYHPSQ